MNHDVEENAGKDKSLSRQQTLQIVASLFYGFCAVAMNFVNKGAILIFPLTNILLLNQMILAFIIISSAKAMGFVQYPNLTRSRAVSILPVTVLYVANVAFSLLSLSSLNLVFYSALKRLTPMFVLVIKASITGQTPAKPIILSVGLIVVGCIVMGLGDFSFDLKGYACVLTSCMLQACYLLLVEYNGEAKSVSTSELMVINACWSIPALFVVILLTGEAQQLQSVIDSGVKRLGTLPFAAALFGCGSFGMILNFSQFLCTMYNSALTTTIVGVLKGVAAMGLSLVVFQVKTGFLNLSGIGLNTLGGIWYSVAKYKQRAEKSAK